MTTDEEKRARFEAWLDGEGAVAYEGQKVNFAWAAWQAALAQPAQPVAWQPDDRTLRVLARAFRKVAPHLIDEFINRAQEALLQEQDDDNQGNGGRARRLAGESDAGHAGPAGQRNDGQHDDGAAEHGAGLLHSLAHENRSGGNAARVAEEGAVDAAPQPAQPVVPREPTPQMVAAGTVAHRDSPVFEAQRIIDIWHAMHDAFVYAEDAAHYYGFPPDAAPQPAPVADAFEQECADVDAILGELGLDPERMRTESGRLILSRIFEAIRAGRATVAIPREPTFKMMEAAVGWPVSAAHPHLGLGPEAAKAIWQTMYDAARGKP